MTTGHTNLIFDKIYLAGSETEYTEILNGHIRDCSDRTPLSHISGSLNGADFNNTEMPLIIVDITDLDNDVLESLVKLLADNNQLLVLLVLKETQLQKYRFLFASGQVDFLVPPFNVETLNCRLEMLSSRANFLKANLSMADKDPITSLLTRQAFVERIAPIYSSAQRQHVSISFSLISVERLDGINRRFGQKVGDRVLGALGQILVNRIRTTDYACRYGGRSFGVLTVNMRPSYMVTFLDDILLGFLSSNLKAGLVTLDIKTAIGGTRDVGEDLEEVFYKAEQAILASRSKGPNQITIL